MKIFCIVLLAYRLSFSSLASCFVLRNNWENRELKSTAAKALHNLQNSCTPHIQRHVMNNFGMGSGLVGTGIAFCNSLQIGESLHVQPTRSAKKWIWNDEEFCLNHTNNILDCYFSPQISQCSSRINTKMINRAVEHCPDWVNHPGNMTARWSFRSSYLEYLFSNVNPEVVRRAEKEAHMIFSGQQSPEHMITVHIRWGDKEKEMNGLVSVREYINSVKKLITKHHISDPVIFLTTEDINASYQFRASAPSTWRIFEYKAAISVISEIHTPPSDARAGKGRLGLISMIVLLISMESRYYVVTTGSNWSVLIEGLRRGVVDPFCNHCTDVIDVKGNRLDAKYIVDFNNIYNMHDPYVPNPEENIF